MDVLDLDYSTKNIPYPSLDSYLKLLTSKTIDFIKRLRWKAFFYSKGTTDQSKRTEYYGFKSQKSPPTDQNLRRFEEGLFEIIRTLKFKKIKNDFQDRLRRDIRRIQTSKKVFVGADKSKNIYEVPVPKYRKIIRDNITKSYRLDDEDTVDLINRDIYNSTSLLGIQERVNKLEEKQCYVLLKDHKPDFLQKMPTRLINPAKTELGRVSKSILQNLVEELSIKLRLNLWISTADAIKWFDNIPNKPKATFLQFDLVNFYPSINLQIFDEAILFAQRHIDIPDQHLRIIKQCRRGILFHEGQGWIKKGLSTNFDVPMGGLDSAQVADFIGIFILDTLSRAFDPTYIGLYRDDGLMVIPESNGPKTNRIHKKLIQVFKYLGFKVDVTSNIKIVNYLDATFNLSDGSYRPYSKDSGDPTYINTKSNHPGSIIRQIPNSVNTRINLISSSRRIFNNSKAPYNRALLKSGFPANQLLSFQNKTVTTGNKPHRRNRPRKVVWFNPPYCELSNINIAKQFFWLVDTCFSHQNPLRKICNRMNLKISYSCCKNIGSIISSHNAKVLRNAQNQNTTVGRNANGPADICNCRIPSRCPLDGRCRLRNVVYIAKISTVRNPTYRRFYIGISKNPWKLRLYVHNASFRNRRSRNHTALSKHFWDLKARGERPTITWKILSVANTPRNLRDSCLLCTTEKVLIMRFCQPRLLLNHRSDLISKCRHTRDITSSPS